MRAWAGETERSRLAGHLHVMTPKLTPIEIDVLAGAAAGETAKATGRRMQRAYATVKTHRAAILDKLGVPNMAAAVHRGHELGLLGDRVDPAALPLTEGQRRAFHAKCSDLDIARELERRTTKKQMLEVASSRFGRLIESANDLTRHEADELLELLELLEQALDGVDVADLAPPARAIVGASA